MKFAAILPTANLWGGVKRFLELGNRIVRRGHGFVIFTPQGQAPGWFRFFGEVRSFADIGGVECDAAFCTETPLLPHLCACRSRLRIFYHVLEKEDLRPVLRRPDIAVFVNSTSLYDFDKRKFGIEPFKAIGGVDTKAFVSSGRGVSGPVTVLTYGRLSMKRKGTRFVVGACERLYRKGADIRLLLFDTPIDKEDVAAAQSFSPDLPFEFVLNHPVERTDEIYGRADIFASAEKNAGWANTCAEAMASGLAVVATASGTRDFLFNGKTGIVVRRNSWSIGRAIGRLVKDTSLRSQLGKNARAAIEKFDWDILTEQIIDYVRGRLA
jgi:glycosyltransferase involved in cell wall biosynthesis